MTEELSKRKWRKSEMALFAAPMLILAVFVATRYFSSVTIDLGQTDINFNGPTTLIEQLSPELIGRPLVNSFILRYQDKSIDCGEGAWGEMEYNRRAGTLRYYHEVCGSSHRTRRFYTHVRDEAIHAVAQQSGHLQDLQRYGCVRDEHGRSVR
jgi:hypothetical protein